MKKTIDEINEEINARIDASTFVNKVNNAQYADIFLDIRMEKEQTQYGLMYVARFNSKNFGDIGPFYARSPARAIAFTLDAISKTLRSGKRG